MCCSTIAGLSPLQIGVFPCAHGALFARVLAISPGMDVNSTKSTIMWVQADVNMKWMARVEMKQEWWAWGYAAEHERHVGWQVDVR